MLVIYITYKPFMWCRSDARLWHALYYYPLEASLQTPDRCILLLLHHCIFMLYINNLLACTMDFILWLMLWLWNISEHDYHSLCYTCVHNVCEYIQSTHWLVPSYCLGQILAWRGALRWRPQNLRNDDSSLVKIGVIQVSCSCGKWSSIDADDLQTASAIKH